MQTVHFLPLNEALSNLEDPLTKAIAEHLWCSIWLNEADTCEVSQDETGQWDFCIKEASLLAEYFRKISRESPELLVDSSRRQ